MTRNSTNCARTRKPLATSPRAASRADRTESERCTSDGSVADVDRVRANPPVKPSKSLYDGTNVQDRAHTRISSAATPTRTTPAHQPGVSARSDTNTRLAHATYTSSG